MSTVEQRRPPATNRVSPLGAVIAASRRGAWMGNRGVLHGPDGGREVVRQHRGRAWITCRLSFRARTVPQWQPGRYTPLFFLDEAVSFAAGHRPCAECRRADYNEFRYAWAKFTREPEPPRAPAMDAVLHRQRMPLADPDRRWPQSGWDHLPDGSFVMVGQGPAVVVQDHVAVWQPDNTYGAHLARPRHGTASVITPPASLGALRTGYPVQIDGSAR